jgi:hypothetical protein
MGYEVANGRKGDGEGRGKLTDCNIPDVYFAYDIT